MDLHELHSSSCLSWVIKPRRMRKAGQVKRMCGGKILGRNLSEGDHLDDMAVEGIIILK